MILMYPVHPQIIHKYQSCNLNAIENMQHVELLYQDMNIKSHKFSDILIYFS